MFDVTQIVDNVKQIPKSITKPQAQLRPSVPNPSQNPSVFEITLTVDALKGFAYPWEAPPACP